MNGLCSRGELLPLGIAGPEVLGPSVLRVLSLWNCGVQVASTCLLLAFLFGVSFSLPNTGVRRSFPFRRVLFVPRIGYLSVPLESVLQCALFGTFDGVRL